MTEFYNSDVINTFFLHGLMVSPNRFRPESKGISGSQSYLNVQTVALTRILNINKRILEQKEKKEEVLDLFLEIQHAINMYMDSSN